MYIWKTISGIAISVSVSMLSSCASDSPTEPSDVPFDGGPATSIRERGGEYTTPFGNGKFAVAFEAIAEGELVTWTVTSTDDEHDIRAGIIQGQCTLTPTDTCDLLSEISGGLGRSPLESFWILDPGQYTLVIDHSTFSSGTTVTYSIRLESS